ncbi:LOW QUALITY PROTEIN: recombination protein RecU [Bacillus sp. JCM 19047]|nr:LOW QUALITY PROTEIN: recombination protein RecU [Bacillus sp. JCM 19047]
MKEKAVIHKKPTPIQIVQVDYPKRSAAVIKEAYFKQASTTDYNGVYKGRYIDFEAKETKNKTSFPLQNIHSHQVDHMRTVVQQHGICFLLIRFFYTKEVYLLDATMLISFYDNQKERKSIKKADIETYGHIVHTGYQPFVDYLRTVDELYIKASKGRKRWQMNTNHAKSEKLRKQQVKKVKSQLETVEMEAISQKGHC